MKTEGFIRSYQIDVPDEARDKYPYSIPAVKLGTNIPLNPKVTFFIGENGSGKSTIMEALAIAAGFNSEGGSKNFNFATRRTESRLYKSLRLTRNIQRERTGFFLRAESFYNVATNIDDLDQDSGGPKLIQAYGGKSLHGQSHGESFLSLVIHRFSGNGLYLLDEPEAALSPVRQLALLTHIHDLVEQKSQFVIATHSPILLSYPEALIYQLSERGVGRIDYENTPHYILTRDVLNNPELYRRNLYRTIGGQTSGE